MTVSSDSQLFESLPSDPEQAFCEFERRVRKKFLNNTDHSWDNERRYINHILAFSDQFNIDVGVDLKEALGKWDSSFREYYEHAEQQIEYFSARISLKNSSSSSIGIGIYILEPAQKVQIHHFIQQIRDIITDSELRVQKKEALLKRLNNFADEVDRDRTRIESFASVYSRVKQEGKELIAAQEKMSKIFEVLGKALEYVDALPSPIGKRALPGPPKQITDGSERPPSEDAEIPF